MATTRYIGTRSQKSFVPFARHLISISRVSVPLSPSVVVERRNKNQFDPLDQEEEGDVQDTSQECVQRAYTQYSEMKRDRRSLMSSLRFIHSFLIPIYRYKLTSKAPFPLPVRRLLWWLFCRLNPRTRWSMTERMKSQSPGDMISFILPPMWTWSSYVDRGFI